MLLVKLLLMPIKLSGKLTLYVIGAIILAVVMIITVLNGICSGLLKLAGGIVLGICVFGVVGMIARMGFDPQVIIPMIASTLFVVLAMYTPDIIQFVLNKISSISYFLFDSASFSLM